MRISLVFFEKSLNAGIEKEITEYKKRVEKRFGLIEYRLKEEGKRTPENQINNIIRDIKNCTICLLDQSGVEMDSIAFAKYIETHESSSKNLLFIIGPHSGFKKPIQFSIDYSISLSKMTFSHRLARLLLYEQVYRAYTIITGHPYHK